MWMFITSKNKYLSNDMKIFGTCSIPLIIGISFTTLCDCLLSCLCGLKSSDIQMLFTTFKSPSLVDGLHDNVFDKMCYLIPMENFQQTSTLH